VKCGRQGLEWLSRPDRDNDHVRRGKRELDGDRCRDENRLCGCTCEGRRKNMATMGVFHGCSGVETGESIGGGGAKRGVPRCGERERARR